MGRAGYVQAVKARGKYYYYVRRSYRTKENGQIVKESLMSLGRQKSAHELLSKWINIPNSVPEEMRKYKKSDFQEWLDYVSNKES